MRACRHPDKLLTAWWWQNGAWRVAPSLIVIDRVTCKCGHWLRLGAARDTARTAVEVRAAELAAIQPDSSSEETVMEWAGRLHYVDDDEMPRTFGGQAGWLAAAIRAHHDEQSKEGM